MQNSRSSNMIIPADLIPVIASFIPELKNIVKLRRVSKLFKNKIDDLLTNPKNAANILLTLNKKQMFLFLKYYAETEAGRNLLTKKRAGTPLTVFEKICLAFLANIDNHNVFGGIFNNVLRGASNGRYGYIKNDYDEEDLLTAISTLSPRAAQQVIVYYSARYISRDLVEEKFTKALAVKAAAASPLEGKQKEEFEKCILQMLCVGLSQPLPLINAQLLHQAIVLWNEQKNNNKAINTCIRSLMITLAAANPNKSEKDWKLIRGGADIYINLQFAPLKNGKLHKANLRSAYLERANLANADLSCANLENADLSYAFLAGANLTDTNLSNADLNNAQLRDALLHGTNLQGVSLHNLVLRNIFAANHPVNIVDLDNVDLTKTKWVKIKDRPNNITVEKWLSDMEKRFNYLAELIRGQKSVHAIRGAIALNILRGIQRLDPDSAICVLNTAINSELYKDHKVKLLTDERDRLKGSQQENAKPSEINRSP